MGHWTRFRMADICRHCGSVVEYLAPAYYGRSAFPFCETCAGKIGFLVPRDLAIEPTDRPVDRSALPTFARFDRGRAAADVRNAILDNRAKQAGPDA